jgi:hypothetical protein
MSTEYLPAEYQPKLKIPTIINEHGKKVPMVTERAAFFCEQLVTRGIKATVLAEELGISPQSIWNAMRKQEVKDYYNLLVKNQLTFATGNAVFKLTELLDHKSGYINIEAIKLIMNANGMLDNGNKNLQVNTSGQTVVNIDLGG